MCFYTDALTKMLATSKINKKTAYTTGDISKILNVSMSTIINLCDIWEPPLVSTQISKGLESYRVGTHRRIPHHALTEWLKQNSNFDKSRL